MNRSWNVSLFALTVMTVGCLSHAAPPTKVKLVYRNWPKAEEAKLKQAMDRILPIMEDLLGPPCNGIVKGVEKGALGDYQDQKQNLFVYRLAGISPGDYQRLVHELVHDFQRPFYPVSGPWAEGIAVAGCYHILKRYKERYGDPNAQPYMGSYIEVFDLYDMLNQPAAAGQFPGRHLLPKETRPMVQSYGLGAAVYHKFLIEHPDFMKEFNADLYRRARRDASVCKSAKEIGEIARTAAGGTMEGMDFDDWLPRQYCLNPENAPGPKLFSVFGWDRRGPRIINLNYWKTEMTGPDPAKDFKETRLSGKGEISAYAFDGTLLKKSSVELKDGGDVKKISSKKITPETVNQIYAFWLDAPDLDSQRMRIEVSIGGEKWIYYYPHKILNGGMLVGADTGEVEVEDLRTGKKQTAKIVKGVFQIKNDKSAPTTLAYTADIDHPSFLYPDHKFVGTYRRAKLATVYRAALDASDAEWVPLESEGGLVLPEPLEPAVETVDEPLLPEGEGPWLEPSRPADEDAFGEDPAPLTGETRFEMERGVEEPILRTRGTRETFLGEGATETHAEPAGEGLSPLSVPEMAR